MCVCVCVLFIYPIFSAKQEDMCCQAIALLTPIFPLIRNMNGVYLRTKRARVCLRTTNKIITLLLYIYCEQSFSNMYS